MALNAITVIDCSTSHLSASTVDWLNDGANREQFSIAVRDSGWFLSTVHGRHDEQFQASAEMPGDLVNVLWFGHVNGQSYVLFDSDAPIQQGLPLYEDNTITNLDELLGFDLENDLHGVDCVKINPELKDLWVVERGTAQLPDGDYEASDGALWVGVGEASVRVYMNDDEVRVTICARGLEADGDFGSLAVSRVELAEEIERVQGQDMGIASATGPV